LEIVLICFVLI
jgi:hypothetical protein